jgi:Glycosyl transferase family 2
MTHGSSRAATRVAWVPTGRDSRPLELGDPAEFAAPRELDVLVPTRDRPAELATVLAGLAGQTPAPAFGVVISDQSTPEPAWCHPAVAGMVRILRVFGHPVLLEHHLPRRGLAEQRAFVLSRSQARLVLFVDDDVWLAPDVLARLCNAITTLRCGFVGNFPHGASYVDDVRPHDHVWYEEWTGPPRPEQVRPDSEQWVRARLHSAANLLHLTAQLDLRPGEWRAYKVAWLGACVLFDRAKLCAAGGFDFWRDVPESHCGEDVAAQLRVLERDGGAGILPSGAFHLESPTTVPDRAVECHRFIDGGIRGRANS